MTPIEKFKVCSQYICLSENLFFRAENYPPPPGLAAKKKKAKNHLTLF
jgi:hypothetical protein